MSFVTAIWLVPGRLGRGARELLGLPVLGRLVVATGMVALGFGVLLSGCGLGELELNCSRAGFGDGGLLSHPSLGLSFMVGWLPGCCLSSVYLVDVGGRVVGIVALVSCPVFGVLVLWLTRFWRSASRGGGAFAMAVITMRWHGSWRAEQWHRSFLSFRCSLHRLTQR